MREGQAPMLRAMRWIADHELAGVLALAPFLLFPTALPVATAAALALVPVLWIARWAARSHLTRRSPLDVALLVLMAMAAVSVLVSPYPELSLPKATGLILGLALYYALVNHRAAPEAARWLPVVGLGIVGLGLVGIDWVIFKLPLLAPIYSHLPRLIQGVPRTESGGFHPNEVGGTLAMLIPVALALWPSRGELVTAPGGWLPALIRSRVFLALTLVAMSGLLLLTQSRAAIAATALALAFMAAVRWRWARWALGALALLLAAFLLWRGPSEALDLVLSLPGSHTWAGRPEIWRNALRAWRDYPFTGLGLNAFEPVSRARYTYLIAPASWDFVHAHNILLQTGVDLGLAGLAAFVAFLGMLCIPALRMRRAQALWHRRLAVGLLGSILAYLTFGAIDAITLGAKPSALLWVAAGTLAWMQAEEGAPRAGGWSRQGLLIAALAAGLMVVAVAAYPPLASRALSNWGQLAINQGLSKQAVAILERAVELDQGNGSAQTGLAEAYAAAGREEEALFRWRIAGTSAAALAQRGEALRRAGALGEAERWLRRALSLDSTLSDAWYYLGLWQQERADDPIDSWREALAHNHFVAVSRLDVQRALGIQLVKAGSYAEAVAHFRAMLADAPADVRTRYNLAQSLSLLGDYEAARSELEQAMRVLEESQAALGALVYADLRKELAIALTTNANRRDDLEAAARWGSLAKQLEPRHPFPYADLAELYVRQGLFAEAIAECRAFLQIRQDAAGIYYLLGQAHAGTGEQALAIQAYREALLLRPDVAQFHYALARAQAASGDAEGAAQSLTRAKSLGSDVPLRLTGHGRLLSE